MSTINLHYLQNVIRLISLVLSNRLDMGPHCLKLENQRTPLNEKADRGTYLEVNPYVFDIQSKLFITSLVITEYSVSDIQLLGTDLFLLKFPLYNRIFT